MSKKVIPVRRDLKLNLPEEQIKTWHSNNPHITHFFNALSLLFPAGERFFIDSVRNYRDEITDPDLKAAVTAFIGQEAMHSREHIEYNAAMQRAGLPADELDQFTVSLLGFMKKIFPKSTHLAGTIALEHFTAILGNMVLVDKPIMDGAQPAYKQLWMWHAMEETEHKAVAYDLWKAVMKPTLGNYLHRSAVMLLATSIFWPVVAYFYVRMVAADPESRKVMLRGMPALLKLMFGGKGRFWRLIPEFFEYFRPGFHPWDQDNRYLLEEIPNIVVEVANSGRQPVKKPTLVKAAA